MGQTDQTHTHPIKNSTAATGTGEDVTGKVDIGGVPTLPDAMTITVQKIYSD